MSDYASIQKMIEENEVGFVDLRFTDTRGRWHHMTMHVSAMDEDAFTDGVLFDGSSIAGWKAINDSDMLIVPDLSTAVMDPFTAQPHMIIACDIRDPHTGEAYDRDPRGTARKAEAYVASTGIGDTVMFGPEAEFFMFDDVRF